MNGGVQCAKLIIMNHIVPLLLLTITILILFMV